MPSAAVSGCYSALDAGPTSLRRNPPRRAPRRRAPPSPRCSGSSPRTRCSRPRATPCSSRGCRPRSCRGCTWRWRLSRWRRPRPGPAPAPTALGPLRPRLVARADVGRARSCFWAFRACADPWGCARSTSGRGLIGTLSALAVLAGARRDLHDHAGQAALPPGRAPAASWAPSRAPAAARFVSAASGARRAGPGRRRC